MTNIWIELFICELNCTFVILSQTLKQKLENNNSRLGKKRGGVSNILYSNTEFLYLEIQIKEGALGRIYDIKLVSSILNYIYFKN